MIKIALIILVILMPISLIAPVILNGVPVFEEPGISTRLHTYLSTNIAETLPKHEFPELRQRIFDVDKVQLFQDIEAAITDLGWDIEASQRNDSIHAVVTSALWGFKDDVSIGLESIEVGRTTLHIQSKSRVGKGDFGANLAHVLDLYSILESRLVHNP